MERKIINKYNINRRKIERQIGLVLQRMIAFELSETLIKRKEISKSCGL